MKITRQEFRELIPMGYGKIIAKKVGVSENAVSNFMRNKTHNSPRIEMAALEIAVELKKKRDALKKQLKD